MCLTSLIFSYQDYYAQKIIIPHGWLRQDHSWYNRVEEDVRRAVYDYAVVRLKLRVHGRSQFMPLAVPNPEAFRTEFSFLAFPEDDHQLWQSECSDPMALSDGNLIMTRLAIYNSVCVSISGGSRGLMVRRLLGIREVLGSNPLGTKTLCWSLLCSHFLSSKLLSDVCHSS